MVEIESLPLFPLSDVVLLPEVSVPLYIFEPRYRQMMKDALAGSHLIGMVTVRPDSVEEMAGDPRIFPIGCVGRIAHWQERPDGTFQLLLVGEQRFRIREEQPKNSECLYRSAHVELLEDRQPQTPADFAELNQGREDLLVDLDRLIRRSISEDQDPHEVLSHFEELPPARLVNALTQAISFRPIERQQLLEADSVLNRFEIMQDLLRFQLAEIGGAPTDAKPLPN
ncbi:MAG: LON peptidase substrate-binding domain-containing protein [Myxococcota bacterium]